MKSDHQLKQDVLDELKWEPSVNATHMGVEVSEGVVTLAGHVETYAEKWRAERAVQRVHGLRGLAVEIDVELPQVRQRTDADIAGAARSALEWTVNLPTKSILVQVEDGWVTISGTVDWPYQRQLATRAIEHLMGVKGVSDQIGLQTLPAANPSLVKAEIEAALRRRATDDANSISVTVSGGEVTLNGTAGSWADRELAEQAAWNTRGVSFVNDNVKVCS